MEKLESAPTFKEIRAILKEVSLFPDVRDATHSTKPDKLCEIDMIARNGHELVAVEVKSTLNVKAVDHYLKVLKGVFSFFPEYKGRKVYGALWRI